MKAAEKPMKILRGSTKTPSASRMGCTMAKIAAPPKSRPRPSCRRRAEGTARSEAPKTIANIAMMPKFSMYSAMKSKDVPLLSLLARDHPRTCP